MMNVIELRAIMFLCTVDKFMRGKLVIIFSMKIVSKSIFQYQLPLISPPYRQYETSSFVQQTMTFFLLLFAIKINFKSKIKLMHIQAHTK